MYSDENRLVLDVVLLDGGLVSNGAVGQCEVRAPAPTPRPRSVIPPCNRLTGWSHAPGGSSYSMAAAGFCKLEGPRPACAPKWGLSGAPRTHWALPGVGRTGGMPTRRAPLSALSFAKACSRLGQGGTRCRRCAARASRPSVSSLPCLPSLRSTRVRRAAGPTLRPSSTPSGYSNSVSQPQKAPSKLGRLERDPAHRGEGRGGSELPRLAVGSDDHEGG